MRLKARIEYAQAILPSIRTVVDPGPGVSRDRKVEGYLLGAVVGPPGASNSAS
jgi:hypothetical protein